MVAFLFFRGRPFGRDAADGNRHWKEGRVTMAAMVLAFVAAVEQNLLGFLCRSFKVFAKGDLFCFNVAVVDHLEKFIKGLEE